MLKKALVLESVEHMPDSFSLDDIVERMVVLDKIERGITHVKNGETIPDEDLEKHLPEWLRRN